MLVLPGKTHKDYRPDEALLVNVCTVRQFQDRLRLGPTGRAYLRSIIEAKSEHRYANIQDLEFSLKMRDKLLEAASTVVDKFGAPANKLDSQNWQPSRGRKGAFDCKTSDYAKALDTLANSRETRLECQSLAQVVMLLALKAVVGNDRFNWLLRKQLAAADKKRAGANHGETKFSLGMPNELLQSEDVTAESPYGGDEMFRPGDCVLFWNRMAETRRKDLQIWSAENAVCVDWKADSKGGRIVTEPLYVGGGISTKEKLVYTEAEMKEAIYETTIAEAQVKKPRYADHDARMKHYSIHMLERWRARKKGSPLPARPRNVPNIGLHATVTRIAYLGGRTDVF